VLLINGERYGAFTQNPMTGRYLLGLAMVGTHPPAAGQGAPNATITIVAPDGGSRLKWELRNVQVTSYTVVVSGNDE